MDLGGGGGGGGGERKTKADTLLCVACVRHTVRVPSLWRLSQQVGEREAGAGCGVCPVCHHLLGLEGETSNSLGPCNSVLPCQQLPRSWKASSRQVRAAFWCIGS